MEASKNKKKDSKITVAIVYAAALLIFLAVFGFIGYMAVRNFVPGGEAVQESEMEENITYSNDDKSTFMYTLSDNQNRLTSVMIATFMPSTQKIVLIPITPYAECDGTIVADIYTNAGIAQLSEKLGSLMNIKIDKYMSMNESTFSEILNIMGTPMVTLIDDIELYDKATDSEIMHYKGEKLAIDGSIACALISYEAYSEGPAVNMKLAGEIAATYTNNFFSHTEYAKNNIDSIFKKEYSDADTNMTTDDYNLMKNAIIYVIENSSSPSYSLTPTGGWTEQGTFAIDGDFISQLDGYLNE